MITFRTTILSTILLCASLQLAQAKSEKDYWLETGLTWSFTDDFIKDDFCNANKENFVACTRALQSGISTVNSHLSVIPETMKSEMSSYIKTVREKQEPFLIVELSHSPFSEISSTAARAKERRKYQSDEISALHHVYAKSMSFHRAVDWSILRNRIGMSYVRGNPLEPYATGNAVNQLKKAAVDPHTRFIPRAEVNDWKNAPDDNYAGIGVYTQWIKKHVAITELDEKGPAYLAGLKPSDLIVSIDDQDIRDIRENQYNETADKLRGAPGSKIKLGILRGDRRLEYVITRAALVSPNLTYKILNSSTGTFGYIRLKSFYDVESCDKVRDAILDLKNRGARGLILDIRSNLGGLVDKAVCIGSLFVGQKPIVQERNTNGQLLEEKTGNKDAVIGTTPVVVLQNAVSASASEILSGALQDYHAAWIVGDRSFGKGSIQHVSTYKPFPALSYAETKARFYQPNGHTNQSVGIIPDFKVPFKPIASAEELYMPHESDLYVNALPPLGPQWKQTRSKEIDSINACREDNGHADEIYRKREAQFIALDYQLYVSEDILSCLK